MSNDIFCQSGFLGILNLTDSNGVISSPFLSNPAFAPPSTEYSSSVISTTPAKSNSNSSEYMSSSSGFLQIIQIHLFYHLYRECL
jgi:hypothetical protein